MVEDHGPGAGGALVDRDDELGGQLVLLTVGFCNRP
jgi:hypothetical protein